MPTFDAVTYSPLLEQNHRKNYEKVQIGRLLSKTLPFLEQANIKNLRHRKKEESARGPLTCAHAMPLDLVRKLVHIFFFLVSLTFSVKSVRMNEKKKKTLWHCIRRDRYNHRRPLTRDGVE